MNVNTEETQGIFQKTNKSSTTNLSLTRSHKNQLYICVLAAMQLETKIQKPVPPANGSEKTNTEA